MLYQDDVIKWKHFPRHWPFARGIHRSPVNSPHKGQLREALMFTLICARINAWVNNREAGDLRRYRLHYDVIIMLWCHMACHPTMVVSLWNIQLWQWWLLTFFFRKLQSRLCSCVMFTENMIRHNDMKCSIYVQMDFKNYIKLYVINQPLVEVGTDK